MIDNFNDKKMNQKKGKQKQTTYPGFAYLAVFLFILKPPSQTEGFGEGMVAIKISLPPHARDDVIGT
jgi:hypothetical protein